MVSLGCKSALLKHVVCHRRQVFMILKDMANELSLSFNFKVDGFNYVVFASSENMKCFGCGAEGHIIRACPEKLKNTQVVNVGNGIVVQGSANSDCGAAWGGARLR
uniref:YTX1 n=1 Tax=Poeciliopsis prolifica TaxID=188132 RepID=A0A0S7EW84_9TELE